MSNPWFSTHVCVRCANFCLLLLLTVQGVGPRALAVGQDPKQNVAPKTTASKHPKKKTTTKDGEAGSSSAPVASSDVAAKKTSSGDIPQESPAPGADYVPCKLTLAELRMLQRPELAPTLSPADVEQLQAKVITAAEKEKPDPAVTGPAFGELVRDLGSRETTASLIGLTPSQGLSRIIELVRLNRDHEVTDADVSWYLSIIEGAVSDATLTGSQQVTAEDYSATKNLPMSTLPSSGGNKAATTQAEAVSNLVNSVRKIRYSSSQSEKRLIRPALYPQVIQAVGESRLSPATKASVLKELGKSTPLDSSDLVDAARQFLLSLNRPSDIGCSMSLMTWREVEYAFGYLIANEYIAVQVVVRNLNDKEQFVMHDVEFEVDADPTGRLGRFYSGRDKIVVRALANTQSTGDPRNLTLNSASGIGQIMATAATIFGGALTNASGVYTGAFLPSLKIGWKDLSGDQIKMIDDNTFSSAASSQTVVPKQGTVVFYTFIPSKQFEEGWWTQPCVNTVYLGRWNRTTGTISNLSLGTYGQQVPVASSNSAVNSSGTTASSTSSGNKTVVGSSPIAGIDVRRALEVCARDPNPLPRPHSYWSKVWKHGVLLKTKDEEKVVGINAPKDDDPEDDPNEKPADKPVDATNPGTGTSSTSINATEKTDPNYLKKGDDPVSSTGKYELFRNAYARPYRKWSGNSLAIFRELANTVVAGVHIVDQSDLVASVTQLDCGDQADDKGVVDYDKVKNDSLACSLVGKNLDKIGKVKLRNAADALDPATADSQVVVTGDSTKATVSWPLKMLEALPGIDYLLYAVGPNSAEQKTNAAVHLPDIPYATSVANATDSGTSFDLSAKDAKPLTLIVKGFRMDKVTGATLTPSVDTKLSAQQEGSKSGDEQASDKRKPVDVKIAPSPAQSATQASFVLDAKPLEPLGNGGATISLKNSTVTKAVDLPTTLGITVKVASATPSSNRDNKLDTVIKSGAAKKPGDTKKPPVQKPTGQEKHR